ncbi:MAG: ParA family protein [bacterium]
MKIIALYNIKGGVGKTATAVNLAYLSAVEGYSTLLWDLDPQGASSFYYRIKPKIKGGAEKFLTRKSNLTPHIKATDFPLLDVLPADFSMRNFDLLLSDDKKPTKRMRSMLASLNDYDYVFLDCPPSISVLSECVFQSVDVLLIPTIPTTLSLRTLKQLHDYFDGKGLPRDKILPFFSMVDVRRKMHQLITQKPPKKSRWKFFDAEIPYISEIERMGLDRQPVCVRPGSRAAIAYISLWRELQKRL